MYKVVLFLAAALWVIPAMLSAQALPGFSAPTWDLAGGVAVNRSSGGSYNYGWNGSISELPYRSHPWIGGTIEGSGVYSTFSATPLAITSYSNLYTAMAGPVFSLRAKHARPFARALLGGVVTTSALSVNGQTSYSSTNDYFGQMLGGGLDLPFSYHIAVRTGADLLRIWQQNNSSNSLRLTGSLVYSF